MDRILFIVVSLVILGTVAWWMRSRRITRVRSSGDLFAPKPLDALFDRIDSTPDSPVGFGYKMSWLAIKASDAGDVVESLRIRNLQAANWHTGFVAAYNGHGFISPSVSGWVFVVSKTLPELGHGADEREWTALMSALSVKYGEAQYFGTHRVSGFNAWARFIGGSEVRAFAHCDEILVDRGAKTAGEEELGYRYFDPESADAESESYWERDDLCYPDEEHVMEVAGKWGVNPQTLDQLNLSPGVGWIGNLVREPRRSA
jgi:hypothetical protein